MNAHRSPSTHVFGHHHSWQGGELPVYLETIVQDRRLQQRIEAGLASAGAQIDSLDRLGWFLEQVLRELTKSDPGAAPAAQAALDRLIAMDARVEATHAAMNADPSKVYWPNPRRDPSQQLYGTEPMVSTVEPFITKETRIASAGSCFANEIAVALQHYGFNYMIEESFDDDSSGVVHAPFHPSLPYVRSSAAWGIIFNTPSFRQLAERAFGLRDEPRLVLGPHEEFIAPYYSPFRESVYFRSVEAYEADHDRHLAAVRRVLEGCDVFIMTLGMTECWSYIPTGSILSRGSMNSSLVPLLERRCLSYEENLENLQRFRDLLRIHNPSARIIVSVSPVPLVATHRADESHVIASNHYSKSVLRVAAESFVQSNDNVHYLPSYELVTWCTERPFQEDLRHVTDKAVEGVMKMFNRAFVVDGAFDRYNRAEMLGIKAAA